MTRFLKYLKEEKSNYGYVSAKLENTNEIKKFINELNIKNTIPLDRLHVTLIYDKRDSMDNSNENLDNTFSAIVKDVKQLGEKGSKWEAITLGLESNDLHNRHNELKELGFQHSYDDYIPHMSIKYKPKDNDLKILKDNLDKIKGKKLLFKERKWEQTK